MIGKPGQDRSGGKVVLMKTTIRNYSCLTLAAACTVALLAPAAKAQLFSWTKEEMVEYT
jgi:hypothetical protein